MAEVMEDLCLRIQRNCDVFMRESMLAMKPNKAAAARARKISLELAADLKQYRKQSLEQK